MNADSGNFKLGLGTSASGGCCLGLHMHPVYSIVAPSTCGSYPCWSNVHTGIMVQVWLLAAHAPEPALWLWASFRERKSV